MRVRRQLGREHRQRLLRRAAVQPRHLAGVRRLRPAGPEQPRAADRGRRAGPAPPRAATVRGRCAALAPDPTDQGRPRGGDESNSSAGPRFLGPAEVRLLAESLGLRPTKQRGQNFVIDPNTVRRIVRASGVEADDVVLEVGPGPRLADPRAARAGRPGGRRRDRPGARRRAARHHRGATRPTRPTAARSSRPTPCGSPRSPGRRRPRWSPTCPTTSPCRSCCT